MSEPLVYTSIDQATLHATFQTIAGHFDDVETRLNAMTPANLYQTNTLETALEENRNLKDAHLLMDDSLELALIRIRRLEGLLGTLSSAQIDCINDVLSGGGGTGPTVTPPALNSIVGVLDKITLRFTKPLDSSSIPSLVAFNGTKTVAGVPTTLLYQNVAVSGSTVVLTLTNPLEDSATVNVGYNPPANNKLKGTNGEFIAQITSQPVTVNNPPSGDTDTTAPVVVSKSPLSGSADVAIDTTLSLGFNEAIKAGTGNITLVNTGDSNDNRTIPVTDTAQITISGSTLQINPTNELLNSANYYVTVAPTAIKDVADNAFAGITNTTTFMFVTEEADGGGLTIPAVVSSAVGENNIITLTFDSVLDETKNAALSAYSGSKVVEGTTYPLTFLSATISSDTVTLAVSASLEAGSTATMSYTAPGTTPLQDTEGTPVASFTDQAITVTTVADGGGDDTTAPTLTSRTPTSGSSGLHVTNPVVFTFSENVQAGSGNIVFTNPMNPDDTRTIPVTDTTQVTISDNTVTVAPSTQFSGETEYQVTVAATAIKDMENNAYAGLTASDNYTFTTAHEWDGGDGWVDQGEL